MKQIFTALMCMAAVAMFTACGGNANKKNAGNDNSGQFTEKVQTSPKSMEERGLPKYTRGEILRSEKHEDGSITVYIANTTLEDCHAYCASLADVGFAPFEKAGFKSGYEICKDNDEEGRYIDYTCQNEKTNTQCDIRFYPEKTENAYTLNGERMIYQVKIGVSNIKK